MSIVFCASCKHRIYHEESENLFQNVSIKCILLVYKMFLFIQKKTRVQMQVICLNDSNKGLHAVGFSSNFNFSFLESNFLLLTLFSRLLILCNSGVSAEYSNNELLLAYKSLIGKSSNTNAIKLEILKASSNETSKWNFIHYRSIIYCACLAYNRQKTN